MRGLSFDSAAGLEHRLFQKTQNLPFLKLISTNEGWRATPSDGSDCFKVKPGPAVLTSVSLIVAVVTLQTIVHSPALYLTKFPFREDLGLINGGAPSSRCYSFNGWGCIQEGPGLTTVTDLIMLSADLKCRGAINASNVHINKIKQNRKMQRWLWSRKCSSKGCAVCRVVRLINCSFSAL